MADLAPELQPWVPADTFAARLALVRQALGGWNVKRVADHCGINDQSWRNWEAGQGHPRDFEDICRKIADATGVDRRWLQAGGPLGMNHLAELTVVECVGQLELPLFVESAMLSVVA